MKEDIRIIVVDDSELTAYLTAKIAEDYLAERGLEPSLVSHFSSPMEALGFVASNVVDVLITDLQMPIVNGEELIRRVKVISPMTTSILMTGKPEYHPPKELDVVGFLEKPFQEDDLFGLLADATECIILNTDILEE